MGPGEEGIAELTALTDPTDGSVVDEELKRISNFLQDNTSNIVVAQQIAERMREGGEDDEGGEDEFLDAALEVMEMGHEVEESEETHPNQPIDLESWLGRWRDGVNQSAEAFAYALREDTNKLESTCNSLVSRLMDDGATYKLQIIHWDQPGPYQYEGRLVTKDGKFLTYIGPGPNRKKRGRLHK